MTLEVSISFKMLYQVAYQQYYCLMRLTNIDTSPAIISGQNSVARTCRSMVIGHINKGVGMERQMPSKCSSIINCMYIPNQLQLTFTCSSPLSQYQIPVGNSSSNGNNCVRITFEPQNRTPLPSCSTLRNFFTPLAMC